MKSIITNSLSLTLVFATVFGVLAHDTQIDQATIVAIAVPASLTGYALADMASKSNEHVHVEKVSFASHINAARVYVPKVQPRDDDRKYIQGKKLAYNTGGGSGLWPSV